MDDYDKRHHKLMLDIVGEDIKDWKQFINDTDIHVIRLKMKYGRLDDLPPMLSPRTMFKSTHIIHALKRNASNMEERMQEKYAPYM